MVMLPNGFTLANLFFGIYAIVLSARGQFSWAGIAIIIGGVCDAIDGRIARATNSGSRFGEELDSLVDAISFGLAPALLMYFAVLNTKDGWDWVFVFLYSACAVMRLARFNIEQAGRAKHYFRGLPSPAAGITLASYYWFSQTPVYNNTVIANWPWTNVVRVLMVALGFLMISNVPYLAWPTFSLKTVRGILGVVVFVGTGFGLFLLPSEFFFPVGIFYVLGSVVIVAVRGLLERRPRFRAAGTSEPESEYADEIVDDDDDVSPYLEDDDEIEYDEPPVPAASAVAPPVVARPARSFNRPPGSPAPQPSSGQQPPSGQQASADASRKRRRRRRNRGSRGGAPGSGGAAPGGTAPGAEAPPAPSHDSHEDAAE
jgi:CDP-diacylglycerol--serine O-phosphatidyltransferase